MAMKFFPGMTNVLEVLNQMWDAFSPGPYNSLPLTGGTLTGPVNSSSSIAAQTVIAGTVAQAAYATALLRPNAMVAGVGGVAYPALSVGVAGVSGLSNFGRFLFSTSVVGTAPSGYRMEITAQDSGTGNQTGSLMSISGNGDVGIARYLTAGPVAAQAKHKIFSNVAEFAEILQLGRSSATSACVSFNGSNGLAGWGNGKSVFYVGKNSETSRSINATGTINASGADYAEYMVKSHACDVVLPGQIVGIDSDGRLTDKWDRAITFMVKSTNPCMVGGDVWTQHLGQRPAEPARVPPTVEQVLVTPAVSADEAGGTEAIPAVYDSITIAPGDTDDEWAAKQSAHEAAVAEFDIALEAARQTVDRIAFAGQVPVNVQGATPGQYIVPVQDGDGIGALAIGEDDITLKQYMRALGQVIAIEDDGRARIIVRAA